MRMTDLHDLPGLRSFAMALETLKARTSPPSFERSFAYGSCPLMTSPAFVVGDVDCGGVPCSESHFCVAATATHEILLSYRGEDLQLLWLCASVNFHLQSPIFGISHSTPETDVICV